MPSIFKYFSESLLPIVFRKPGYCGLKCSRPEDYNDPFELFLGVDLDVGPEGLATYRDILQSLEQFQTTCFSKSPVVSPMWAHYANNHSGFVVEFDADSLEHYFEDGLLQEVTYRTEPDPSIRHFVQMAAMRKKPRDAYFLQSFATNQAYFSKYSEWAYEQEIRLAGLDQYVEDVGGIKVLYVPMKGILSIVAGSRASPEFVTATRKIASENNLRWYGAKIGKSYSQPFFNNAQGETYVYRDGDIRHTDLLCGSCCEPLPGGGDLCSWCSITDEQQYAAAANNPFRILHNHGALESYLESADAVGKRHRSKRPR